MLSCQFSIINSQLLQWYLAAEEYLAKNISEWGDGVFFTWIVEPTVIFGRHQVPENEVNTDYCREHNINIVQRKSGGGCVYADRGNLMLSYIVPSAHPEHVFSQYLDLIAAALADLGLAAVRTEHNDILVDGCKVSGNACYALPTATIVHGTLLYDVDFDVMQHAITPSAEKLQKHGVESVRQRVRNLRPLLNNVKKTNPNAAQINSIVDLAHYLSATLCQAELRLKPEAISEIESIAATYRISKPTKSI